MLKVLKRKTDAAASAIPPWRPNFRNESKLPDVKVIRTSFFVNAGVFVLLVASITTVVFVEFSLGSIRRETSDTNARFERNRAASEQTIATYKLFQAESRRISELNTFMTDRLTMREILSKLAELLPSEMALASAEIGDTGITLKGFVSGLPTKASGIASSFEKSLKDSPLFGKRYDAIKLSSLGRDNDSGRMRFTLELRRTKPEPKKGTP